MDKLSWCLKDANRLIKIEPNADLAKRHIIKSKYNYSVLLDLERLKKYDWALNVGFYAIYHCLLALLAKHGYQSKNQTCTVAALLDLIGRGELNFDRELIAQFDNLDAEKSATDLTVRESRELSTYGVETNVDTLQVIKTKQLALKIQKETISVLR